MLKYSRESKKQSLLLTLLVYLIAFTAAFFVYEALPSGYSVLTKTLIADVAATVVVFIFSFLFNNSSFYDPYWSIVPPVILVFWIYNGSSNGEISIRSYVLLIIAGLWGIRLTMNWILTWPGLVHEDWRYVTFRNKFKKFYWPVSLLGIHMFPTLIVFLCSIPAYLVIHSSNTGLNYIDYIAITAGLIAVYFEWRSDYELITHRKSKDGDLPIMSGLWKLSRHPNYFGEILFWFSLYLFSLANSLNNYLVGIAPLAMLLLFLLYSIPAMEKRQLERRKEYKEIQDRVSMLFPFPPKKITGVK